jgi:hypothetical protein
MLTIIMNNNISFGPHKNTEMEFHPNLLYYRRYIDDILGIWIPSIDNNTRTWERFKSKLNSWGPLKWIIEEPSNNMHFQDLNIQLENSSITTETYQKPMNLYLYTPPPPSQRIHTAASKA